MITPPTFPGYDGLLTLSRREGVDIRPTLLRVLTDLYVQANTHTREEEQQYVELASRLIDQVDDATLSAVHARLSIYPAAPAPLMQKLGNRPSAVQPQAAPAMARSDAPQLFQAKIFAPRVNHAAAPPPRTLSMMARDAAELSALFFSATETGRAEILRSLATAPLKPAAQITGRRAELSIQALEMAAYASDVENFAWEIADVLSLPDDLAMRIARDIGGEPLLCAMKSLAMPSSAFQRVLLFLDPVAGASVTRVHRLSRLYTSVSDRAALIMLAAWQGGKVSITRGRYQSALYDDERNRARHTATQPLSGSQSPLVDLPRRTTRS